MLGGHMNEVETMDESKTNSELRCHERSSQMYGREPAHPGCRSVGCAEERNLKWITLDFVGW